MEEPRPHPTEDGGVDSLDVFVSASKGRSAAASGRRRRPGALLAAPALWLVPVGWLLGGSGLGLATPALIAQVSPLLSIAMAALGVFVGLGLRLTSPGERRLLLASTAEATVVIGLVGAAALAWLMATGTDASPSAQLALGAAAIAAAASSAPQAVARGLAFTRLADLDDVMPILLGALLLAFAQEATLGGALFSIVRAVVIAVAFAAAGWLLLRGGHGEAERVTVVAGLLLLLGGAAQYLGSPALLTGLAAGALWARAPGEEFVRRYLDPIQRPVVVLLVVAAGALLTVNASVVVAAVLFAALRLAGKLLGGHVAARILSLPAGGSLGRLLAWPGVIGVAFLVNVAQVQAADGWLQLAFGAVTLGTVLSEVAALWLSRSAEAGG